MDLFPHFYLSYNELSPEQKSCFSYCAVFPKDHEIVVEELIRLWIAQGYVRPRRRGECLELVGLEYFNNLAMRSFFQEIRKGTYSGHEFMKCKMHDIVHDFARFLTKNECHVLDGIGGNLLSERARHLTILEGTEETFSSSAFDLGRLRSLFAFSRGRVPQDLFRGLNCVRTLTLSHCQLREVPTKVGSLVHLRHLDLSWNPFETLPEAICDLYYLETLDISYCRKLSCLPKRIEGLVHLKHLFNHNTYELLQMQQGLGKLTSLCSLTSFIASNNSVDLAILKDLKQLERLYVDIHGKGDFGSAELGKKIYLREMLLRFSDEAHSEGTPSWIQTMEPPPNLQQLALVTYPGTQLPSWLVTETLISSLTKLFIVEPRNISSLPTLWKLSSLEELRLEYVEELEYLGKEFFGITLSKFESSSSTEAVAFPNLRKLHFLKFPNWTNWEDLSEEDEKVVVSIMPCLEELEIEACDELKGLPHRILGKMSSLKSLKVQHCNKLRDRYSNKTGDDWLKISSRIPRIHISQY
ncbi:putative disease resistance protein RGA3 [Coffea eugenioides]|uniref:putative disease resistance protein RGA3 n=1 Tax=Coffea eugenioides TaxID=49369 RepID=UPI000F61148C|nr:putative disease resistance protein RGA3 [Coffea eugenioides]XP_027172757.1 putative disease resistance protein RGA3 [Coffea eugenioides]